MASREELLQSIKPGMELDKAFFLKVYGYEISWPGFAEKALAALEIVAGCSMARAQYAGVIQEYEFGYEKAQKVVAADYRKECERKFEEAEKKRGEKLWREKKRELLTRKRELLKMSLKA